MELEEEGNVQAISRNPPALPPPIPFSSVEIQAAHFSSERLLACVRRNNTPQSLAL